MGNFNRDTEKLKGIFKEENGFFKIENHKKVE